KFTQLRRADRADQAFLAAFARVRGVEQAFDLVAHHAASQMAALFAAGYHEVARLSDLPLSDEAYRTVGVDTMERALAKARSEQLAQTELHASWLATTASAAPFVGLFGTVWGIMNSFRHIARTGSASLAVVAPGISEALITTAIGLAAAIPAVVAYNHFSTRVRKRALELDNFSQEVLNLLQPVLYADRGSLSLALRSDGSRGDARRGEGYRS
ncbi:MAG: MotA/TolQ/ExbB proton channel family protein, partial [Candidatus Eisenbacteria bacterium]